MLYFSRMGLFKHILIVLPLLLVASAALGSEPAFQAEKAVDLSGTYSYESPSVNCENPQSIPRGALHLKFGLNGLDDSVSIQEGKNLTIRQLSASQFEVEGGYFIDKSRGRKEKPIKEFVPTIVPIDFAKLRHGKKDIRYMWDNGVLSGERTDKDAGTGEVYAARYGEVKPVIDQLARHTKRSQRAFGLTPNGDLEISQQHSIEIFRGFSKTPVESRSTKIHCVLKRIK